ncbi:hypothetical protein KC19_1G332500 [Ceratodon purpureus]|uniref:Uncharacterized protein n=1 Tax=Ceratodon purpureus TaxID=3225 RepID=A0A8T0JFN2_CERPU|nr:hypothetical protein KC19_1G332500 [Ceratodon purpureus]
MRSQTTTAPRPKLDRPGPPVLPPQICSKTRGVAANTSNLARPGVSSSSSSSSSATTALSPANSTPPATRQPGRSLWESPQPSQAKPSPRAAFARGSLLAVPIVAPAASRRSTEHSHGPRKRRPRCRVGAQRQLPSGAAPRLPSRQAPPESRDPSSLACFREETRLRPEA